MNTALTVVRRLYVYQKERFPVVLLGLSLVPAVVSSGVVATGHATLLQGVLALVASIAYLLHIRILDECRDFDHDTLHHQTRPLQRGAITRGELLCVDMCAVGILCAVALASGLYAVCIVAVMLVYSYCAGREFFVGEALRQRFFVYNGLNLVQMILMQVFVYAVFVASPLVSAVVGAHLAFTSAGTLVFELVRKLKLPGSDGSGRDTYTAYLGFLPAVVVYGVLALACLALYVVMVRMLTEISGGLIIFVACAIGAVVATGTAHAMLRTVRTDIALQLTFVTVYALLNLSLYVIGR